MEIAAQYLETALKESCEVDCPMPWSLEGALHAKCSCYMAKEFTRF